MCRRCGGGKSEDKADWKGFLSHCDPSGQEVKSEQRLKVGAEDSHNSEIIYPSMLFSPSTDYCPTSGFLEDVKVAPHGPTINRRGLLVRLVLFHSQTVSKFL